MGRNRTDMTSPHHISSLALLAAGTTVSKKLFFRLFGYLAFCNTSDLTLFFILLFALGCQHRGHTQDSHQKESIGADEVKVVVGHTYIVVDLC